VSDLTLRGQGDTGSCVAGHAGPVGRRRGLVLLAVGAALFLSMLDTTVVTVALPDLQRHSAIAVSDLQWVVNGYLVVFAALTLAGGALADRLGRRRLLVAGLVVFAVGSVVTAGSDPLGGWDGVRVGRIVQGLGAALSEPATLAVVRRTYDDDAERSRALGVWAAVAGFAIAVGPVVGGLLVALGGWRAVFWANVPLAAVAVVLVLAFVPESSDRGRRSFDVPGLVLGAVALGAVSYGLIEAQQRGFADTAVVTALALSVLTGVGFVVVEAVTPEPSLPLPVVLGRRTLGPNAAALAASFTVFAVFFFVSLDLQTVGDADALGTAAVFLPMTVVIVAGALVAGRWSAARGPTEPMVLGLLLAAGGLLLTDRTLGVDPSLPPVALALLVVGTGLGLVLAPAADAVLSSVGPEQAGVAAATVNLARQTGGLLAVGVLGVIAVGRLDDSLETSLVRLKVPVLLRPYVRNLVQRPGATGSGRRARGGTSLVDRIVDGARGAFVSGSHAALLLSAGTLVVAALLCLLGAARRAPTASTTMDR